MKSEIGRSRGGLRPYPLRFHVKEAGADAKLTIVRIQYLLSHLQGLQHTTQCPDKNIFIIYDNVNI
jgi:hypothetical protein